MRRTQCDRARVNRRYTHLASIQIVLGLLAPGLAHSQSWSAAASISAPRYWHTATLLNDGTVLVAGGRSGSSIAASAEIYDPSTDTWSLTGSMSSPRYLHTATLIDGGFVLVTGGYGAFTGDNVLRSAEYYDPSTQTWIPTDDMMFARAGHTATRLPSGAVLVAGGRASSMLPVPNSETWSLGNGFWTLAGPLMGPRFNHVAALYSGGVLIAGGNNQTDWLSTAETYDGAGWSSAPSMSARRALHAAAVLADGRVLVSGGDNFGTITASAEIYDGVWTNTASLAGRRENHTATLLYDGTVLACGGENFSSSRIATAEIYDPTAQSWTSIDNMLGARAVHTATLLLDGRVLVAGGVSNAGQLSTAELYAGPAPGGGAIATR